MCVCTFPRARSAIIRRCVGFAVVLCILDGVCEGVRSLCSLLTRESLLTSSHRRCWRTWNHASRVKNDPADPAAKRRGRTPLAIEKDPIMARRMDERKQPTEIRAVFVGGVERRGTVPDKLRLIIIVGAGQGKGYRGSLATR